MKTFEINTPEEITNCDICSATIEVGDEVFTEYMDGVDIETCSEHCMNEHKTMKARDKWFAEKRNRVNQ